MRLNAPTCKKRTNLAQRHYINISHTKFYLNQTNTVGKLETSLSQEYYSLYYTDLIFKKLITIVLFVRISTIPNITLIDQYIIKITLFFYILLTVHLDITSGR